MMCCANDSLSKNFVATQVTPIRVESLSKLRRRPRRVSFEKAEIVGEVISCSSMTAEERDELWYHQSSLSQFKTEARELCRRIRDVDVGSQPLLDVARVDTTAAACTRGLEHRASIERQKNKFLAMRAILKAQARYEKSEQLAMVASKCTAWAKEIALCTGYQDFYYAYNPALLHLVPQTPSVKFPLVSRKKSSEDDISVEERPRRKKQRTLSPVPVARQSNAPPLIIL